MPEENSRWVNFVWKEMFVRAFGVFVKGRPPRPAGVDYQDIGEPARVEVETAYFLCKHTSGRACVSQEIIEEWNSEPEFIVKALGL